MSMYIHPATEIPGSAVTEIKEKTRNLSLDGLRGIAVAAVLVYHLWPAALPGGFLGVDLFFVLSGYLITNGLLRSLAAGRGLELRRFWVRRTRRLLPGMLSVVLGATALSVLAAWASGSIPAGLRTQWIGALTYTSNWLQIAAGNSYFAAADPPLFQHLWSLAVEEQFYLLWPFLLLLFAGGLRRRTWLVAAILMLAAGSAASMAFGYAANQDSSPLYFGTWTHGFGLLLGAAAACAAGMLANRILFPALLSWTLLLMLLAAMFVLEDTSAASYRGGMLLFALAAAILILALERRAGGAGILLKLNVLRWMGERSYGLYLWHWPLLVLAKQIFPVEAHTSAVLCVVPTTFLAAGLSWKMLEQPVLAQGLGRTLRRQWDGLLRCTGLGQYESRPRFAAVPLMALTALVPLSAASMLISSPQHNELQEQLAQAQQLISQQEATAEQTTSQQPAREPDQRIEKEKPVEQATKKPVPVTGRDVTAVGDSVMLAASPQLLQKLPGIAVDASVGAQAWDAPAKLRELEAADKLRSMVVVGLGTNGAVAQGTIDQIRAVIGPDRQLLLVTAYASRSWTAQVNSTYKQAAEQYDNVHLVDWANAAGKVTDMARDGIHPGPRGSAVYAQLITKAVANMSQG